MACCRIHVPGGAKPSPIGFVPERIFSSEFCTDVGGKYAKHTLHSTIGFASVTRLVEADPIDFFRTRQRPKSMSESSSLARSFLTLTTS